MQFQCYFVLNLGLHITGHDTELSLGETATITCSSDLDIILIEWWNDGQMMNSSTGPQTSLVFNPVNDTLHNIQYTCKVTTAYGTLEQTIAISVKGNTVCVIL